MPAYTVRYCHDGQPSTHTFDLKQPRLPAHEAALHVMLLHFGDGENSLVMPPADASPEQILEQAEVLGFSDIQVV
ncbi:hypothetical protein [Pseudomonas promysalinigenes]|uniref:YcgL domain-containing protein n=1 Tax=Pseudomonas promysalinigenes TaxID=485898 RepID=A0ABY6AHN9_9PSED|nr:hypothetical protein [Pseudomonas promysalinigenes]UXH38159.1 hypothetical protein N5C08_14245 [Pseudomonas promysalinigenes]